MATADRQRGKFDILYATTTDPASGTNTDKTDPTNYTRVGLLQDLGDEFTNETDTTVDRDTGTHEDAVATTQSSSIDVTCNVQRVDSGGSTGEDAGQLIIRDAAQNQDRVWWLINPEDSVGTTLTGLELVYGSGVVESFDYTRNQGDFKQFEASLTNKEQPTYQTA